METSCVNKVTSGCEACDMLGVSIVKRLMCDYGHRVIHVNRYGLLVAYEPA